MEQTDRRLPGTAGVRARGGPEGARETARKSARRVLPGPAGRAPRLPAAALAMALLAAAPLPLGAAAVTVDAAVRYQTIRSWGSPSWLGGPETVSQAVREQMIAEVVEGMGLNRMRFEPPSGNRPGGATRWEILNDDGSPWTTEWSRFNTPFFDSRVLMTWLPFRQRVEAAGDDLDLYVSPSFFDGGSSGSIPGFLWHSPGEHAEYVLSIVRRLAFHGIEADFATILNEPGNNNPFSGGTLGTFAKVLGPHLRARGLATRLQFPEGVNPNMTLSFLQANENDPDVWPHVTLLSYHLYGTPDPGRSQIRDWGLARGIPTAQTEAGGPNQATLFDDLTLGGTSTWEFYGSGGILPLNSAQTWFSRSATYWACRQVIRYVRPGAVRVEASSDDPAIRALAFEQAAGITAIAWNTASSGPPASVTIAGLAPGAPFQVSRSSGTTYTELGLASSDPGGSLVVDVPAGALLTVHPHPGPNRPPVLTSYGSNPANLTIPASALTLSAAAQDPEGDVLSFRWSVLSQPAGANAQLASPVAASCAVSGLDVAGDYRFGLEVTDGVSTLAREVPVPLWAGNQEPIVIDLHNRNPVLVILPATATTLRASPFDREGDATTVRWSVVSAPPAATPVLATPDANSTQATGLTVAGDYVFRFEVTAAAQGHVVGEDLTVHVYPLNTPPTISSLTATPGSLSLPASSVRLSATTSDADGDFVTHWWRVTSAPAGAKPLFSDQASPDTVLRNLHVPGRYWVQLTAVDNWDPTQRSVSVDVAAPPPGTDSDGDTLDDSEETSPGTDGFLTDPWDLDSDDDGLSDADEVTDWSSDPNDRDSDDDGLQDGLEAGAAQPIPDPDGAGPLLGTDPVFFEADTNPWSRTEPSDPDTDAGGVWDGAEDRDADGDVDAAETFPLDPSDDRASECTAPPLFEAAGPPDWGLRIARSGGDIRILWPDEVSRQGDPCVVYRVYAADSVSPAGPGDFALLGVTPRTDLFHRRAAADGIGRAYLVTAASLSGGEGPGGP